MGFRGGFESGQLRDRRSQLTLQVSSPPPSVGNPFEEHGDYQATFQSRVAKCMQQASQALRCVGDFGTQLSHALPRGIHLPLRAPGRMCGLPLGRRHHFLSRAIRACVRQATKARGFTKRGVHSRIRISPIVVVHSVVNRHLMLPALS
jgi:hypothetical protein